MKYRGYELEIVYLPGANFRVTDNGRVVNRTPTTKDIDHVRVTTPYGHRFNESSIKEAKIVITKLEEIR